MAHLSEPVWVPYQTQKPTRISQYMNRSQTYIGNRSIMASAFITTLFLFSHPSVLSWRWVSGLWCSRKFKAGSRSCEYGANDNNFFFSFVNHSSTPFNGDQGNRTTYSKTDKPLTDAGLDEVVATLNLGCWNSYGPLHGPSIICEVFWKVIKSFFSQVSGAKFYSLGDVPDDVALQTRNNTLQGTHSITELNWLPNGGHLFFAHVAKVTGPDAKAQYETHRPKRRTRLRLRRHRKNVPYCVHCCWLKRLRLRTSSIHSFIKILIEATINIDWGEYRAYTLSSIPQWARLLRLTAPLTTFRWIFMLDNIYKI